MSLKREVMEYDVVIVGAGPSGLAAGIRLKQLALKTQTEISVCIIEKGAEVGSHLLSGAVLEPRALNELLPDWQELGAPVQTEVTHDRFHWLSATSSIRLPTPAPMRNHGNYIISIGQLCRWLATQAEALGVEIYPGFAATEVLYNTDNAVIGVATGDMGCDKNGEPTVNYQPGMELHAEQTLFAEGCRGSLTKTLFSKYQLTADACPQTYGIGLKELWNVDASVHRLGEVMHTIGWPLNNQTYGGSFIYHAENQQVAVGFVIGLDYANPYLNPFEEFQRFKTHPKIRPLFENGERVAYGARALNEGGLQSIPKLCFPGGALIGCSAGFLNVPKIKGIHTAMKSGMVAAETAFDYLTHKNADATIAASTEDTPPAESDRELHDYPKHLKRSWLWAELKRVRNIRPGFRWGLWPGLCYAALDSYLLRGKAPWTFKHKADHTCLRATRHFRPIAYPKPDGKVSFDKLSSVFLSGTNHAEHQAAHLKLSVPELALSVNHAHYGSPEQYYCPAGVYELVAEADNPDDLRLQINFANCVHCKTCDIKDPRQNITWVPPEGGGGPNYPNM